MNLRKFANKDMKIKTYMASVILWFHMVDVSCADSIKPGPRPEISVEKALEIAKMYSSKKIDINKYYIDRVWLGVPRGEKQRKWIVSWCADENDPNGAKGWFIVVVDMKCQASEPAHGVQWLPEDEENQKRFKLPDPLKLPTKDNPSFSGSVKMPE